MAGFLHLLGCVGRAVVKNAARSLVGLVPFGEAAFDIARDVREEYRKDRRDAETAGPAALPDAAPSSAPAVAADGSGRAYTLVEHLAEGDAADLHLAQGDEAAGYFILKASRIPGGRVFLDQERRTLAALLSRAGATTYRQYLPDLIQSFPMEDGGPGRVNVFRYEPGFYTLEQVHERHPAFEGRHLAWIFKRLLTVLGFCHGAGTLHGAVLPCHVMLHAAAHGLRLVGWGQSVERGRPIAVVPTRYRDWYPPEVLQRRPASPATDLFLAARCLIHLAGGSPPGAALPEPMRRFLRTCLLERPGMRPQDAWGLLDEFDVLLRRLYGPPQFLPLVMT
jgi:serine/threonine protein kinase